MKIYTLSHQDWSQDSLSRLRCLGIYEDNDPEKPGYDYGK